MGKTKNSKQKKQMADAVRSKKTNKDVKVKYTYYILNMGIIVSLFGCRLILLKSKWIDRSTMSWDAKFQSMPKGNLDNRGLKLLRR
jgi:hypothetical protein